MQQLCEAGEAEFLEIMDLVGMASKPMHVRRLQKALQEWVQNSCKSFLFTPPISLKITISIFDIIMTVKSSAIVIIVEIVMNSCSSQFGIYTNGNHGES